MSIPIIDLSKFVHGDAADRLAVGRTVDDACRNVGFFSVAGHGVETRVLDRAHAAALAFFDLPLSDRLAAARPSPTYPYGYTPLSAEALSRSMGGSARPDLKETYNVGPVGEAPRPIEKMADADEQDIWSPTLWPAALPELRPALVNYYLAMSELSDTLMDLFAVALGLGSGWFGRFIDEHSSALRLAHYPALPSQPAPDELRAGAHTDYGTLTILRLDAEPGLQVQRPNGSWADVEAPNGTLVVNLGDLMQRWSNDRWRSTMHRVVVADGHHDKSRLTMPFFHNANWDARVECIVLDGEQARHEPVQAGAHLMAKFRSTVT